ncbi:MAG TPA: DUF4157 domain-containing protein [Candidatus Accumulibacter phosphatis]|nr:DUF4157 domain-containing protein [Candidatus Accumulibacter phosphatis]
MAIQRADTHADSNQAAMGPALASTGRVPIPAGKAEGAPVQREAAFIPDKLAGAGLASPRTAAKSPQLAAPTASGGKGGVAAEPVAPAAEGAAAEASSGAELFAGGNETVPDPAQEKTGEKLESDSPETAEAAKESEQAPEAVPESGAEAPTPPSEAIAEPSSLSDVGADLSPSSGERGEADKPNSSESNAPAVEHVLVFPGGAGQLIDPATRTELEERFGQDFSDVRVHTDPEAVESAADARAKAYTVGQDVVFGEGRYAPGTSEGRRLLAHELAHVVQQSRGGASGIESNSLEAAARQAAGQAIGGTTGSPIAVTGAAAPGIMRDPEDDEEGEENASRRREGKKRTQQRERQRATAGKQPRQIGRAEAERELRELEKSYRKPGANQRSPERKNADLKRFQRLLKRAGGTGLEKNQRSGKFDELQRTPAKTAGAPQTKSVAGGAQLPGQELRPGKDSYAQPDYSVWRRHKDGTMERVHVNLKSDQIQMQTPARAQSTAKRYVKQAVRNVRHLAQGEGIVISFAHKPSDEVQAAMNKEFFKAGSPVKEVRYGTSAIRAEDYKPPTQAPTAPKAPPAKGARPKGGKAGGAKSPGVPTTTPKAPKMSKTPKAPGTKAPGAKSAPLKGAKPPKAPAGPKTATPKAPGTKASGPKAPAPKAAPLSETPAAPAPKSAPLPQAQPQPLALKTPAPQTPTPQPKAAPPQAPAQAPVTKSSPPPLAAPPVRPASAWKGGLKAGGKAAIWALVFAGLDYYVHRRLAKELEESITMTHNGAMPWAQRLKREDPSKPVYMMVKVESKEYSKFIPLLGWMPEPPVLHMISMAMVREPIDPPIVEVQDNRLNPWTPGVTTTITHTELMVE